MTPEPDPAVVTADDQLLDALGGGAYPTDLVGRGLAAWRDISRAGQHPEIDLARATAAVTGGP